MLDKQIVQHGGAVVVSLGDDDVDEEEEEDSDEAVNGGGFRWSLRAFLVLGGRPPEEASAGFFLFSLSRCCC
jgi:hypothetical protein